LTEKQKNDHGTDNKTAISPIFLKKKYWYRTDFKYCKLV